MVKLKYKTKEVSYLGETAIMHFKPSKSLIKIFVPSGISITGGSSYVLLQEMNKVKQSKIDK